MTTEVLEKAETSILRYLKNDEPESVLTVLDHLDEEVAPAILRRAVWSLVAKGRVRLTPTFGLLKVS